MTPAERSAEARFTEPELAVEARRLASAAHRRDVLISSTRSVLLVAAAVLGAFTVVADIGDRAIDLAGLAALLAFVGLLGIRLVATSESDQISTHDRASAVADLIESHAWRYAMRAAPYYGRTPRDAQRYFIGELEAQCQPLKEIRGYRPQTERLSDELVALHGAPLDVKKQVYRDRRLAVAAARSGRDSRRNTAIFTWLTGLVVVIELIGIPAGFFKAAQVSSADLIGLTSAVAASVALWVDSSGFDRRAQLASSRGHSLVFADAAAVDIAAEDTWSEYVARVEGQLSLDAEATLVSQSSTTNRTLHQGERTMSAGAFFDAVDKLVRRIWDGEGSSDTERFVPDVIVGSNPGGAIVGGIMHFSKDRRELVNINLKTSQDEEVYLGALQAASWKDQGRGVLNVLVVDASCKSGKSIATVVRLVRKVLEQKGWDDEASARGQGTRGTYRLRTAVITWKNEGGADKVIDIDYWVDSTTDRFPYGPV